MKNPFIFGKVVRGEHFCNREKEISKVKRIVESNQHLVIISPRRYGKTSLAINALERSKIPFLYVDCTLIEDERTLMTSLVNEYANKLDNFALLEKVLKKFDLSVSITANPLNITINQVKLESLKSLMTEINKHYIIVFDEFQDIYEKDKQLINKIRSIVQFLNKSVIMLGSKRHLLNTMFLKPRGIFYNFGLALHLEKIEKTEFKQFIMRLFKKYKVALSGEEAEGVLEISELHPFFTQYFCHFLFENKLGNTSVQETLKKIIHDNSVFYEEIYRTLPATQRRALHVLCTDKKEIYSAKMLEQFSFKNSQALQKALKALMKKEIVDKNGSYYITDVFFRYWLLQKSAESPINNEKKQ